MGINRRDRQTQHQQALIKAGEQPGEPHPLEDLIGVLEALALGHQQCAIALQGLLMAAEAIGGEEGAEGAVGGPLGQGGRRHRRQIAQEGAAVDLEQPLALNGHSGGIHGHPQVGQLDFGVGGDQRKGLLQAEAPQQADGNAIDPGDTRIGQQRRQLGLGEDAVKASTGGEGDHLPASGGGEAGRHPVPDAIGDAIPVGVARAVEIGGDFFSIAVK